MDFESLWKQSLRETEIIRPRIKALSSVQATDVPYIFLAESAVNKGDTVVRRGEVHVEKPSLILPSHLPQFEGFDEDAMKFQPESFLNFLLVRGIRFPSLKYNNHTHTLDLFEGDLDRAVAETRQELERQENVSAGLVIGPEQCWQFSILIFTCSQVARSAESDFERLFEEYRRKNS